jgi:hypothetical protein
MICKRRIAIGVGMLMLVVLGILCYVRWEVWFGNVPEPPYSTPDKPQRILLTFGDEDMYSRNVSWSCGETLQASFLELADENDTLHIEAAGEVLHLVLAKQPTMWLVCVDCKQGVIIVIVFVPTAIIRRGITSISRIIAMLRSCMWVMCKIP